MIELRELRQGDFSFDENWFVYRSAAWIDSLGETAGNPTFEGIATHYSALSAWEYRMSVPLDLDHLSG